MDDISSESEKCAFEGKTFPAGAELCSIDLCKQCDGGEFKLPREQSLAGEDLLADPAESYFIPL
ncbi:MAG: hypothetical protein WAW37_03165 [Syntrophobacteraceae bacterium]